MKGWVIFVLAFVIYFVSIFGGFIQDDGKIIQSDKDMGEASALVLAWTRPYYYMENEKSVYRPVTSFSFYLNSMVTGRGAWGFRLGNVLIYAWVCWLVFQLMNKFGDERWAFWGAVLFVVLPIHTEVVNNIVGRAEMLSLALMLLAMMKGLERKWEISSLYLFLAMLSKETAVVGVPILLYLISTIKPEKDERLGAGFFVIMTLIGFILLRMVVLGGGGLENRATIVENPLKFVTTEKRVLNAVWLIPFGVSKIIFPVNLSYDYSYNQIKLVNSWFDRRVILGAGLIGISLVSLLSKGLRENKLWMIGMMLFWGPILITGNILFPIGTIFGERLWFWPSLGVVMMVLSIGSKTAKNRTPALPSRPATWRDSLRLSCTWSVRLFGYSSAPILMAILFLYGGRTVVRNLDWLSQERLFLHDVKYVSESVMAQNNAAAIYLIQRNLTSAKVKMEQADAIYSKYPELLNNWGLYYLWTGKTEEAKNKFEECLVERPGNELCSGNLKLVR